MPIEELLALYNCVTPSVQKFSSSGPRKRSSRTSRNALNEKTAMAPPETPKISETKTTEDQTKDGKEDAPPANKKVKLDPPEPSSTIETTKQKDRNPSNLKDKYTSVETVETVSKSTNDDTKKSETKPKVSDSLCSEDKESSVKVESDADNEDDGTKENSLNKGNTSKKIDDTPVEGEKTTWYNSIAFKHLFLLCFPNYIIERIFLDKDDKKDLKSESHKKEKDKDESVDKSNADEDIEDALEEGLKLHEMEMLIIIETKDLYFVFI